MYYNKEGVLKGLVTLHVDDMMIGGDHKDRDFSDALERIKKSFDFGKWAVLDAKNPMVFCGGRIKVTAQEELTLDYEEFFKKVLPINIVKNRNMDEPLNASEINKARGLIGALQWPAGQGAPFLNASVSILAGGLNKGDGKYLQELNKMLRFAKANGQVALRIAKIAPSLEKVCFVCFSDAALSVRSDLSSQGGFMIVACNEEVLIGKAVPYTLVSWRSFKLPRVCRSSLAAEAQACAMALDELMIVKVFFGMMLDSSKGIADSAELYGRGKCAIVTDAKALYDAAKRENISQSLDKRAALEILCVKDAINSLKLAFMVGRLWSRKTEQDLAEKVKHLSDKIKHVEEVAKLAREDTDHWEDAASRAMEDLYQMRTRRYFMAKRGVRIHTRQECQYLRNSQIELYLCEWCSGRDQ